MDLLIGKIPYMFILRVVFFLGIRRLWGKQEGGGDSGEGNIIKAK